jgi:hypothetical protein
MHTRAYEVPHAVPLSAPVLFLLQRMLEPDPRVRITVPQILQVGCGAGSAWWPG